LSIFKHFQAFSSIFQQIYIFVELVMYSPEEIIAFKRVADKVIRSLLTQPDRTLTRHSLQQRVYGLADSYKLDKVLQFLIDENVILGKLNHFQDVKLTLNMDKIPVEMR
jgi:hypothetical protein